MVISKTPLRCSFFGGGTDFPEYYNNSAYGYGTVISTALNMYIYIMVTKRFDDNIRVCYTKNEFVETVDQVEHNIIRESMRLLGIEKGIDVIYSSDIPLTAAGVGLASSSALAVGVLAALHAYKGEYVSQLQIAREACIVERDKLKHPMGIQDQYACACGGFKKYKFYPGDEVRTSEIIAKKDVMTSLKRNLMLFFTGITRVSGTILEEQKNKISDQYANLDKMVVMAEDAETFLGCGKIDEFGGLLDVAWRIKKGYALNVSNEQVDNMYESAMKNGALGGKILGAGGGGFLLLYVPYDKQNDVKQALSNYRLVDFDFESEGTRIIFSE